ncbi:MAG: hypothetical protein AB7Q00_16265 [Phycisphaerales bacterium]
MTRHQMVREINSLASGTIARLCGSPLYEDISTYTNEWVAWVMSQHWGKSWDTWQDCNAEFEKWLVAEWRTEECATSSSE